MGAGMSEILKCIGGPNDGETARLVADQREIVVHKDTPASLHYLTRVDPGGLNYCNVLNTLYTRRRLRLGPDSCVDFLAPEDWTDARALEHALAP